jgi:hypothetical protein
LDKCQIFKTLFHLLNMLIFHARNFLTIYRAAILFGYRWRLKKNIPMALATDCKLYYMEQSLSRWKEQIEVSKCWLSFDSEFSVFQVLRKNMKIKLGWTIILAVVFMDVKLSLLQWGRNVGGECSRIQIPGRSRYFSRLKNDKVLTWIADMSNKPHDLNAVEDCKVNVWKQTSLGNISSTKNKVQINFGCGPILAETLLETSMCSERRRSGGDKRKYINEYETPWRIMVEKRRQYNNRTL